MAMDWDMIRQLARMGVLVFSAIAIVDLTVLTDGNPAWLLSLLRSVAFVGMLAYMSRWGRLSEYASVAAYAGAFGAVALTAALLVGGIDIPEGLMPLPVELGYNLLLIVALTSLWWHYRRHPRQT